MIRPLKQDEERNNYLQLSNRKEMGEVTPSIFSVYIDYADTNHNMVVWVKM